MMKIMNCFFLILNLYVCTLCILYFPIDRTLIIIIEKKKNWYFNSQWDGFNWVNAANNFSQNDAVVVVSVGQIGKRNFSNPTRSSDRTEPGRRVDGADHRVESFCLQFSFQFHQMLNVGQKTNLKQTMICFEKNSSAKSGN